MNSSAQPRCLTYFPAFDSVRFVAAFGILIYHVEQFKSLLGLPTLMHWSPFGVIASRGVNLFFVLSGFLITYLLINERESPSGISIPRFYGRRVLRIFPLYYLIAALGLLIAPSFEPWQGPVGALLEVSNRNLAEHFRLNFVLYSTVLSNLTLLGLPPVWLAAQSWSVAYEEQFYLVWPWIVGHLGRLLAPLLLLVAVGKGLVCLWLFPALEGVLQTHRMLWGISRYLANFPIECLCAGALAAWLFIYRREWVIRWASLRWVQRLALVWVALSLVFSPQGAGAQLVMSFVDAYVLLNLATSESLPWGHSRATAYLGRISYGIYMYNPLAIVLSLQGLYFARHHVARPTMPAFHGALYGLASLTTFALAALSYRFVESSFLRLKTRLKPK